MPHTHLTRREVLVKGSAAVLAFTASGVSAMQSSSAPGRTRVLIASERADGNGILNYDWNGETGELTAAGVAASIPMVAWITFSHGNEFLFSASELSTFEGKPTGEWPASGSAAAFWSRFPRAIRPALEPVKWLPIIPAACSSPPTTPAPARPAFALPTGGSARQCGPSTTPNMGRMSGKRPRMRTLRRSLPTIVSRISTTWAAIAFIFTAPIRRRRR